MGLWAWIMDRLLDPGGPVEPSAEARARGKKGGAVATREPPPDAQRESTAAEQDSPVESQAAWWCPTDATITELQDVPCPTMTTEGMMLENVLVSHFDGHDLSMPPMPIVAESVLKSLRHERCQLPAIAREIGEDQVLAVSLLRVANSPLYRGLDKITGLEHAVVRLGARAIRTLMLHESMRAAAIPESMRDTELARIVWRRSLVGAFVMRSLAAFTQVDREDAFSYGLLHDIGNVIVLRLVGEQEARMRQEIDLETFEYLCFECHLEFGELVADAWRLPDSLKTLIVKHHEYPEAGDPLRTERLLLQVTDMILSLLGDGPTVPYDLLASRAVQDLGFADRTDFHTCLNELPKKLEDVLKSL